MESKGEPLATPKKGRARTVKGVRVVGAKKPARNPKAKAQAKAIAADLVVKRTSLLRKIVGGSSAKNREELLKKVRSGLKYQSVEVFLKEFDASQKEVAQWLSIPNTTLSRRKKEGTLKPDESDRAVRFARLRDQAVDMMGGDTAAAINWLKTPKQIFNGESPLDRAVTEIGARDVEDLMGRIQHGVFS